MKAKKLIPELHIYGQVTPHDETVVVGNVTALTLLRNAINQVLANPTITAKATSFTADGEAYVTNVRCISQQQLQTIPLPYAEPLNQVGAEWDALYKILNAK